MRFVSLKLQDFRNYAREEFSFDEDCNVIFGENAQGKTNLLEALGYLSSGHSPRARSERELMRFDAQETVLVAQVWARERDFTLETELRAGKPKRKKLNGVPVRKVEQERGVIQTVYFCPEDLNLIREGAAARRRFMDAALCQLRPRYAQALRNYTRACEAKAKILREGDERPDLLSTLPEFDHQMIYYGAALIHHRARFVARLGEYAAANHSECSGGKEALKLHYETVKTITNPFAPAEELAAQLRAHMEAHVPAERATRQCLSGPHKDDIAVAIDDLNARSFSSQGQTRTAALSMKLAEREIYKNVLGEYPVLLLDDVLSELDPKRQEFVLNRIGGGLVFITCCEEDRLVQMLKGKIFQIKAGKIV